MKFQINYQHTKHVITAWIVTVITVSAQSTEPAKPASAPVSQSPVPGIVQSKASKENAQPQAVQLGVSLSKPVTAVYAQLPKLPRGCGFLLQNVTVGGTADVAGLKPMDVIWKLGDQLLINESQLMTLLSHYQPGDQVTVSYFRAGLEKVSTLKLQGGGLTPVAPVGIAMNSPFPGASSARTENGIPALPMRVISYEDRSASISDKNGTATLIFREGKPWLRVESSQGLETYNGPVTESQDIARVPVVWRSRLPILQRSLEESIRLRRLPRVRRVPTPKHHIVGGE